MVIKQIRIWSRLSFYFISICIVYIQLDSTIKMIMKYNLNLKNNAQDMFPYQHTKTGLAGEQRASMLESELQLLVCLVIVS